MPDFQDAFEQLDQCLARRMQQSRNPAMVVALTDRFDTIRLAAYGYAYLEGQTPIQMEHLFAIGSIGKSFTALAILQAQEAGLLDLHAPVTDYLPWFEVLSRYGPISLHHLLTHASGLPAGTEFSPDPRSEVWSLRDQETGFEPGKHFYYSDTGYKIAGLALEAATGKTYAELMWTGILEPLGMHSTYAHMTHAIRPDAARGYRYLHDDRPPHPSQELVPTEWVETNSGDGCIVSTAEDMARYARFFLNDGRNRGDTPLLSEANFRKMVEPMIEEDGEQYSYGLNLFVEEGIHHAGHGGDVPGYESYMWLDLDNRLASVTLMTQPYTPRASFLTLEYLRAVYATNTPPEMPPMPDDTHVVNAEDYTGIYRSGKSVLAVEAYGHHLYLSWGTDGERVMLEERTNDRFYANHPRFNLFLISFLRGANGHVVEMFYGPQIYTNERYDGPQTFETPVKWQAYVGHYRAYNPWKSNFRVFIRKDRLILCWPSGEEENLVALGEDCFRIGDVAYIPERLSFDQFASGQALRATRSGCHYYRFFTA
jgi:D-alanyl-D-alanine carboxypeptidase